MTTTESKSFYLTSMLMVRNSRGYWSIGGHLYTQMLYEDCKNTEISNRLWYLVELSPFSYYRPHTVRKIHKNLVSYLCPTSFLQQWISERSPKQTLPPLFYFRVIFVLYLVNSLWDNQDNYVIGRNSHVIKNTHRLSSEWVSTTKISLMWTL